MRYQHIVFDIDGTLIDTEYAVLHSLQKTIHTLTGQHTETEQLTFSLGIPGEEALQQLNIPDVSGALKLWIQYLRELSHTTCLFDGIEQVLETLQSVGCHIGIVTSQIRSHFESDFGKRPIRRYFETVVCADDTEKHKPDPEPLLHYMAQTGAPESQVLYIGDSKYDMMCARSAHVDFALAGWGSSGRVDAPCILQAPADIPEKYLP